MNKKNYKLLLIDDEPEDFSIIFSSDRWNITLARNEEDANTELSSNATTFDGILLDLALRGSASFDRGLVFLKELKEKVGASIPVVVITKDFREDTMMRSLNQGAAGFFRKGACYAKWIENQFLEIINTFKLRPFIGNDLFFSKMPALIKKRELLLKLLLEGSEKKILSLSGATGTGKQFLVKFLKKNGVSIGSFDFAKRLPLDPNQFEQNNTVSIHSIAQASREQQKSLYDLVINSHKSFLFIIDDTFDFHYDSGFIIEEIFNLVSLNPKIELYKLIDRAIDIPDLIQSFVSDPKVCPRHLPYFGNSADHIFTKEVLELLIHLDFNSNIRELQYLVQYAICQAVSYGASNGSYPEIINHSHLPKRYFHTETKQQGYVIPSNLEQDPRKNKSETGQTPIEDSKFDYSQEDMPSNIHFLSTLEEALSKNANSLTETAKKLNLEKKFIKEKLKRIFDASPQIFRMQMYTNIFNTFAINIFMCYAEESKNLYKDIKKHVQVALAERFGRIEDKDNLSPGDETKLKLELMLTKSHIVCFVICADLLTSEEVYISIPLNHFKTMGSNDQVFIPIIGKHCLWLSIDKFATLEALPKDKVPISASPQKDEVLTDVAKEIHRVIDKLRFDKYIK